jgi:hypothetical protein
MELLMEIFKEMYSNYDHEKAIKRDSSFASKVKNIVILGGAFLVLGNVNPAAEANVSTVVYHNCLLQLHCII